MLFLAAIAACPLAGVNAWPFSTWELFSRPRPDAQVGWQAVEVGRTGGAQLVSTSVLPHGHERFGAFVAGESRVPGGEAAACVAWLRDLAGGAETLRIYRLSWKLSDRRGRRAAPPSRRLVWTCRPGRTRAA